jgi:chorismate lyase / 3-hydroxybenzoate synthase
VAPLLSPMGSVFDAWCSNASQQTTHRQGCARYISDGVWLWGCAEIDDSDRGLRDAAQRAYSDVFAALSASPCHHLLRLWNFVSQINAMDDGLERYRHFNIGRQQAFLDAGRSAFDGAPAASALGTRQGPLRVFFLAGRQAPLSLENPRQVSAYHYPDAYGPRPPTFSRAALVGAGGGRSALFISGTASIVGHASVHVGDVGRQTQESLANMEVLRQLATKKSAAPFLAQNLSYTVYLRHAHDMAVARHVFEQAVGRDSAAAREAVYLQADVCRADLLVEIEAHGFAATEGGV